MTKADEQYQDALRQLGCIVCNLFNGCYTPASIHHILSGGRRIGERHVLPLCYPHHQGGFNDERCVSRHPYRVAFIKRYGSEEWLRDEANKRIRVAA